MLYLLMKVKKINVKNSSLYTC